MFSSRSSLGEATYGGVGNDASVGDDTLVLNAGQP